MKPRVLAKHVGILTGPNIFIHAYERLGVIEEALTHTKACHAGSGRHAGGTENGGRPPSDW